MSSLLDMYELTGNKKYLNAAEYVAQVMCTCLWVPGVDGDKKSNLVEVNNLEEIQKKVREDWRCKRTSRSSAV